jgi:hypothetical protein
MRNCTGRRDERQWEDGENGEVRRGERLENGFASRFLAAFFGFGAGAAGAASQKRPP